MGLFSDEILSKQNGLSGTVDVVFEANVAIIYMRCGENRFNLSFINKLNDALTKVEQNKEITVLITTSEGKFYSNGLDLDWLRLLNPGQLNDVFNKHLAQLLWRFMTFPVPTIAAINGHAFAMGAFLSLSHDYVIMTSEKGWWSLNEVFINAIFPPFFKEIIRMRLPSGLTNHSAAVMGHRFTGQEAEAERIAIATCPQTQLISKSKQFSRALLQRGPYIRQSLQNMKCDFYESIGHLAKAGKATTAKL